MLKDLIMGHEGHYHNHLNEVVMLVFVSIVGAVENHRPIDLN